MNTSDPDLMVLIDSVKISENGFEYLDDGRFNNTLLDDELIYCYALTTYGGYDNPIIPAPLVNNSQVVCRNENCVMRGVGLARGFGAGTGKREGLSVQLQAHHNKYQTENKCGRK